MQENGFRQARRRWVGGGRAERKWSSGLVEGEGGGGDSSGDERPQNDTGWGLRGAGPNRLRGLTGGAVRCRIGCGTGAASRHTPLHTQRRCRFPAKGAPPHTPCTRRAAILPGQSEGGRGGDSSGEGRPQNDAGLRGGAGPLAGARWRLDRGGSGPIILRVHPLLIVLRGRRVGAGSGEPAANTLFTV